MQRKKEGKERAVESIQLIESIHSWIDSVDWIDSPLNRFNVLLNRFISRSVVFLINTWAACRNMNSVNLQQFLTPQTLLSPSKLPRSFPTRVSTDPSIWDRPAAIGVKISGTVLEEYTFHKQGDSSWRYSSPRFLFSEEFSAWSNRSQRYITNPC